MRMIRTLGALLDVGSNVGAEDTAMVGSGVGAEDTATVGSNVGMLVGFGPVGAIVGNSDWLLLQVHEQCNVGTLQLGLPAETMLVSIELPVQFLF